MGAVRAVLLEESLICGKDESGGACQLLPGAVTLLRRLRHSELRVGICYEEGANSVKVNFITEMATTYSFEPICWNPSCLGNSFDELLPDWNSPKGSCVFVTSRKSKDFFHILCSKGWRVIVRGHFADLIENENVLFIERPEELHNTLCRLNKSASDVTITTIGYIMKPSREEDFLKRGAFPICPTKNGLIFVPLDIGNPLSCQMQVVDAVLHKATDEVISIDLSASDFPKGITYSKGMQELERYVQSHSQCCIIDPLNNVYPLLDRLQIQHILLRLNEINGKSKCRIRAPYFLKVDDFMDPTLKDKLPRANLYFPNIVKPQVACGVTDAHKMAVVFKIEDFGYLNIPLPAVVQEYVDHGSIIFKFYVLGEKVFYAAKKSMPNADALLSISENCCTPITFDSLRSLPTSKGELSSIVKSMEQRLDVESVKNAANCLRKCLNLTIFGFDIVIQESSGDHVIVDVNYLPSFKEIPDADAIPAFFDAIKLSYEAHKFKSSSLAAV